MTLRASAPGNLFFFGEYAVLYGKPCICGAVNLRTYVTLNPREDSLLTIDSDAFGHAKAIIGNGLKQVESKSEELKPLLDFAGDLYEKFGIKKGFGLKIESQIPPNSGMSSSTAVFCAMLKAISTFAGKEIKNEDYFGYILPHQAKVHGGKASGAEIISSSVGGFNIISKKGSNLVWEPLGAHNFSIVVGNTRISAPTKISVKYHVPSMERRFPELVKKSFESIEKIGLKARDELTRGNIAGVGKLMNENQKILKDFKVSHPKLDDCIGEAMNAGAAGAKLSGSGWGGIMFAICDKKAQDRIAKAIENAGCEAIKTEIGCEGARIESE